MGFQGEKIRRLAGNGKEAVVAMHQIALFILVFAVLYSSLKHKGLSTESANA